MFDRQRKYGFVVLIGEMITSYFGSGAALSERPEGSWLYQHVCFHVARQKMATSVCEDGFVLIPL